MTPRTDVGVKALTDEQEELIACCEDIIESRPDAVLCQEDASEILRVVSELRTQLAEANKRARYLETEMTSMVYVDEDDCAPGEASLLSTNAALEEKLTQVTTALRSAIKVADEARTEWDEAPSGMRAGKIIIALSGGCKGYRELLIHEAATEAGEIIAKAAHQRGKAEGFAEARDAIIAELNTSQLYAKTYSAVREAITFYGSAAMGHARAEVAVGEIIATDVISAVVGHIRALQPRALEGRE